MAQKRYRAVGTGLVSHPTIKAAFVGWRRVTDSSKEPGDFVAPGGYRYRKLPNGEVLDDNAMLRTCARPLDKGGEGSLEELPLETAAQSAEEV